MQEMASSDEYKRENGVPNLVYIGIGIPFHFHAWKWGAAESDVHKLLTMQLTVQLLL